VKTFDTFGAIRLRFKQSWRNSVPMTLQQRLRTVTRRMTSHCFKGIQRYLYRSSSLRRTLDRSKKNDVECPHLVLGNIKVLHVLGKYRRSTRCSAEDLVKIFVGSREEAWLFLTLTSSLYVRSTIGDDVQRNFRKTFFFARSMAATRYFYPTQGPEFVSSVRGFCACRAAAVSTPV